MSEACILPNLTIDHIAINEMLLSDSPKVLQQARQLAESPLYSVFANTVADQTSPRLISLAMNNSGDYRTVFPKARQFLGTAFRMSILCLDTALNGLIDEQGDTFRQHGLDNKDRVTVLQELTKTIELASDSFCSYTGPFDEDTLSAFARSAATIVEGSGEVSAVLCDYLRDEYSREVEQSAYNCLNIDALAMGAIGITCLLANGALRDRFSVLPENIDFVPEDWLS